MRLLSKTLISFIAATLGGGVVLISGPAVANTGATKAPIAASQKKAVKPEKKAQKKAAKPADREAWWKAGPKKPFTAEDYRGVLIGMVQGYGWFHQSLADAILKNDFELVNMENLVEGAKEAARDLIAEGRFARDARALLILDAMLSEGVMPHANAKKGSVSFGEPNETFRQQAAGNGWTTGTLAGLMREVLSEQGHEVIVEQDKNGGEKNVTLRDALYANLSKSAVTLAKAEGADKLEQGFSARVEQLLPPMLVAEIAPALRTKTEPPPAPRAPRMFKLFPAEGEIEAKPR